MGFCESSNIRTIRGHGLNEALKRGTCINYNYACKKKNLVVGINIELVKIIKLSISEHNLTIMPCHCHRRFLF
jgi:hypothetical protein